MSWAKDEWKQNLPPNALQKIVVLEDEVEDLRKVKQQQLCQYEGLQAAFQKQKQMTGDEKAANSSLSQEVQELSQKCLQLDRQVEKFQSELKIKAQKVDLLEDQVQRAKQKSIEDNEEMMNLQREMGLKQNELRQSVEKNSELLIEFDRMKQANVQLAKDVEAFTAKIKDLTNENESFRDQLFQRVGRTNLPSVQAKKEHEETEKATGQDVENTGGVFLEMMKKEKNALISENSELKKDKEHMKRTVEEKERELERIGEKLAATTAEVEVKLKALAAKEKDVKKLREEVRAKESELKKDKEHMKRTVDEKERELERIGKKLAATTAELEAAKEKDVKKLREKLSAKESEIKKVKEHMKCTVEEEERELERVGEKLAATAAELEAAKAKDVKRLREKLSEKESACAHELEVKNQKLTEELECLKRNYTTAEETIASMSEELQDAQFTIQSMEAELGKKATLMEARRERIEELQREKQELADKLECLKEDDDSVQETVSNSVKELKSVIKELEAEMEDDANLIEERGKRIKVLEQEKSELGRELDHLEAELENDANMVEERGKRIKVLEQEKSELGRELDRLKAELENGAILMEGKSERIEVLEKENTELGRELDCLKQRGKSEEDHVSRGINERETLIRKLEADVDEKAKQLKEQLLRGEHLLAENSQLSGELEALKCAFKEINTSYSAVARALDESRALVETMRHQLRKKEQQTEKLEQEVDGGTAGTEGLIDRELKVANRLKAGPQSLGTNVQDANAVLTQQRIMGDVLNQMREPETSEESLQPQGMTESLSTLLVQLQEEHEMVEVKVRQCLKSLHETCGIVGSQADEQDDKRSPNEILTRLGELRVFLDSLLESAFHCRLMIHREDHEITARVPEVDTAFVLGESSREGFAQLTRGHGIEGYMSWDDYDNEKAFQTFKDDVECIVQQLETEKKAVKRKAKEQREVKRAHTALREIRRRSRQSHAGPSSCENPAERDEQLEELVGDGREQLQLLSGGLVVAEHPYEECRMEAEQPLKHVPNQAVFAECALEEDSKKPQQINPNQPAEMETRKPKGHQSRQRKAREINPSRQAKMDSREPQGCQTTRGKTLEINPSQLAEIMKVALQENNQESERNLAEHFKRLQEALQGRQIRTQDEEEKRAGVEQTKSALDGRYAVSELEISKKKLTGVQRSIKELISALAAAHHESEARRGHVERLTRELRERESRHEEECAEFKNVVRCASQQEMALKRRVKSLDAEKEELNNELRQVIAKLKEKELELVGNSQKLRDLEARSTEGETTLRNNIMALQAENEALWEDYKEASKQAERREADVRGIKEHLKGSEAQLIAIFHRLCNVDEDVRRARKKQVYDD